MWGGKGPGVMLLAFLDLRLRRFIAWLLGVFAGIGLLLAARSLKTPVAGRIADCPHLRHLPAPTTQLPGSARI